MMRPATQLVHLLGASLIVASSGAFLLAHHRHRPPGVGGLVPLRAAPASSVHVLPSEDDVAAAVHRIVENAANDAIAARGRFALAIPGGSVLKVLSALEPSSDWPSKTTLAFVNHKCVPVDDLGGAIEAQARSKFVDRWGVGEVVSLGGTGDGLLEASGYEAKLRSLPEATLPRDGDGFPVFDLCLVGVGDDGHIGSIYPGRDEIGVVDGPWVVASFKKSPPGISLTLPVMQRAKRAVISAAGQSAKYPSGKASAMRMAISDGGVDPRTFPAMALREYAVWILDAANGSELGLGASTVGDAVAAAEAAAAVRGGTKAATTVAEAGAA
jgi:6-phosphogluconolactonase